MKTPVIFIFRFLALSRRRLLLFMISLIVPASQQWAEDPSPIPHAWPSTRYADMKQQSPFAIATPVDPAAQSQASFASNWFVSGIGRLNGEDFVTIKARDLSVEFSLYGHDTNTEYGTTLASVEWSDKIGKSTVVITKGTENATLEFNEAEILGPPKVTTEMDSGAGGARNGTPSPVGGKPTPVPLVGTIPNWPAQPPMNSGAPQQPRAFPQASQKPIPGIPLQEQTRQRIPIINASH